MHLKRIVCIWFLLHSLSFSEELKLATHKIEIRGYKHLELSAIQDALDVSTTSKIKFWADENPEITDKLIPTLEATLKSFYDSEGFYDATFNIEQNKTTVKVTIVENRPVMLFDINISSDFNISTSILTKKDTIFRAKDFIGSKTNIVKSLLNEGHCSYDLDAKAYVDLDKHRADVKYVLKKGGICTFGDANIKGLKEIDKKIVLTRVRAKKGDKYSPKKLKETYSSIYGLNSFDMVQISVERKIYNVVPVDITLNEVYDAYHFEAGVGYDTYIGPRVHTSLVKKNFMGDAQKTGIKLSWSKKEQLAIGEYFKPALFIIFDNYGIDFGTEFGYSNLEYRGFQEEKGFGKFYVEHNEGNLALRIGLALENIDISLSDNLKDNEELKEAINAGTFLLFYPYVDIVYDARDDKLNPKYGYYLATSFEYGVDYKPDATSYIKALAEARLIHTFDKLTLSAVGKVGVVDKLTHELPESKFFFSGGSYSNRAYGYRSIGVIDSPTSDSISGAASMLNLSLEANYPIMGDLYGALFTDNTMQNEESYDFSGEVISSVGLGVRYVTPIGPFKLDVGFNVNKPSQYGISFQIGQSF
ncbi:MAG: BamA/TamA family outer membrane protein [Campylobacterota bacterium]|nr:BamA/TamA family outer membrane protein [Campylobacterota bacterium]